MLHDCLEHLSRLDSRHNRDMLLLILKIVRLCMGSVELNDELMEGVIECLAYNMEQS